jgi:hypothetical protein
VLEGATGLNLPARLLSKALALGIAEIGVKHQDQLVFALGYQNGEGL